MNYVRKYRKPIKRCKKGKSQGGPGINFDTNGCSFHKQIVYSRCYSKGFSKIIKLIGIALIVFFFATIAAPHIEMFYAFIVEKMDEPSLSFFLCSIKDTSRLTKKAEKKITEIFEKKLSSSGKICSRDIDRFYEGYINNKNALKKTRKKVKFLQLTNHRLQNERDLIKGERDLIKEERDLLKKENWNIKKKIFIKKIIRRLMFPLRLIMGTLRLLTRPIMTIIRKKDQ